MEKTVLTKVEEDYKDNEVKEAEANIVAKERKLYLAPYGDIYVKFPTVKTQSEINMFYSRKYSEFAREGSLMFIEETEKFLKERGIWTEEDEKALKDSSRKIADSSSAYYSLKYQSDKKPTKEQQKELDRLLKEIEDAQETYIKKVTMKHSYFENTVEKKAEEKSLLLRTVLCCFDKDGNRIWNSIEDLENGMHSEEFEKFISDCIVFWKGLESPLSERYQALMSGNKSTE